jgi:hypothetical protein
VADASVVPIARRQFLRTERLLIRFDVYGAGDIRPEVTAALLNSNGDRMTAVPVSAAAAGATHQIDLGLASLAPGEYVVEVTVKGVGGQVRELVPLRVGS